MNIVINLDLSAYDIHTLTYLHEAEIITVFELDRELERRGYNEWTRLCIIRDKQVS